MSFEPREYLRHILAEAEYLAATSVGLTRDKFEHDPTHCRWHCQRLPDKNRDLFAPLLLHGEQTGSVIATLRAGVPLVAAYANTAITDRRLEAIPGNSAVPESLSSGRTTVADEPRSIVSSKICGVKERSE